MHVKLQSKINGELLFSVGDTLVRLGLMTGDAVVLLFRHHPQKVNSYHAYACVTLENTVNCELGISINRALIIHGH